MDSACNVEVEILGPLDENGNPKYNCPYVYAQGKGFVLESSESYEDVVYAKIP